jgi:DNA polymerase III subunit epsilon
MRRALIFDTETTGLSPETDRCIEYACILFDLELAVPVEAFSTLIQCDANAAESVNHIPAAALADASSPERAWAILHRFLDRADVVLAHRADFDRSFIPADIAKMRPWCCTKFHVEWPLGKTGDHLIHLALAHGVGVVSAHRAMTDCDILARLLMRVAADGPARGWPSLQDMIAKAMRPRVKVVSLAPFDDKDTVKAHGFAWDAAERVWWKDMPPEDVSALPFQTRTA